MAVTNVSFEMNTKLKDQMSEICEDLGMSMDDAFQIFARKMVNEQGIPFEVTEKDYPEKEKKEEVLKWVRIAAAVAAVFTIGAALVRLCTRPRREEHHWF